MNQAILTGSAGFIGSVVVRTLLDSGVSVLGLGRRPWADRAPGRLSEHPRLVYLQVDMADIGSLPDLMSRIGWTVDESCVFFNFAWGGSSRLSDLDVSAQMLNVGFTANAFRVASQLRCQKFVHVGSMEEAFSLRYLDLDFTIHSYYNRHVVYSLAKVVSKNVLKLLSNRYPIDLIFACNSHVMGPNDDKDSFLQVTLGRLINREPLVFSTGDQMFDVVSVNDCARAYELIGRKGVHGREYWVGSGEPRRLREYVEIMARLYPSEQELQFGKMPYNDITLAASDFAIDTLFEDTGFKPQQSYEDTVHELHRWLRTKASERDVKEQPR